jgi:N-methylhydantoinase A
VTADVGGTSFDTCLVSAGQAQMRHEGEIDGMPVQAPWIDVRSIGAGGGSIAYVDEGGLLRVGPRSAGARPGPACYGRGGTEPTVTDAAVVLGLLPARELAGRTAIDLRLAREAMLPLARRLGLELEVAAQGVLAIVSAAMASAIRSVTTKQGYDVRRAALLAFGGAGPLFGCLLAAELDSDRVVVPPHAGNFSAWGLLAQPITRSASQTLVRDLHDDSLGEVDAVLAGLMTQLRSRTDGQAADRWVGEAALDLRYTGQEYTLNLDLDLSDGRVSGRAAAVEEAFAESYSRIYGHRLEEPVEIVAVRALLRRDLPSQRPRPPAGTPRRPTERAEAPAYSFTARETTPFKLLERSALGPGESFDGPAIVREPTATTYVDAGFRGVVADDASIDIVRSAT